MPTSPTLAEGLTEPLLRLYLEAELILLGKIARRIGRGIEEPGWAHEKLLEVNALRREVQAQLAALTDEGVAAIQTAIDEAYARGVAAAVSDLRKAEAAQRTPGIAGAFFRVDRRAVAALVAVATHAVQATHLRILRTTEDAYRQTVADAVGQVVVGTVARREAAQQALDRLLAGGITGFVDRAGRGWDLASYVEMAVRTGAGHAAVQGSVDRFQAAGNDLVIVSNAPAECRLCVAPGTFVEGPTPEWRCRLEYRGDLISIRTASGKQLSGTPDHSVLTPFGWRRLKELRPGDQVVSDSGQHRVAGVVPDHVQVPARIEEVGQLRAPLLLASPPRRDLDGDRTYRQVDVVWPDWNLTPEGHAALGEPLADDLFVDGIGGASGSLGRGSTLLESIVNRLAAHCIVCRLEHSATVLLGSGDPPPNHRCAHHRGPLGARERSHMAHDAVAPWTSLNASASEVVTDHAAAHAEGRAELLRAFASNVALDQLRCLRISQLPAVERRTPDAKLPRQRPDIADADIGRGRYLLHILASGVAADQVEAVGVRQFRGHVWDLQTQPSWYVSNGLISHNCRPWEGKTLSLSGATSGYPTVADATRAGLFHPGCRHNLAAFVPGLTRPMTDTADPEGDAARQQQRYLERQIRYWKRRQVLALDDAAQQQAGAKVRTWQAHIRQHVAANDLRRLPHRESITRAR